MPIAAAAHHAVPISRISPRDGQLWVGEDGYRETLVGHLLLQRVQGIGRNAHNGVDAQRLELTDVRLDVLELIPAGLAGQPLLEVEQDGLPALRGEIERSARGGRELDGGGLRARTRTSHLKGVLPCLACAC